MRMKDISEDELESLGEVWVHFYEYRITHGYLHLIFTDHRFQKKADVYMVDCNFISGPTSGGPWVVSVSYMEQNGETIVELSAGGELLIRALRVEIDIAARNDVETAS
jgi:hypothetical protein